MNMPRNIHVLINKTGNFFFWESAANHIIKQTNQYPSVYKELHCFTLKFLFATLCPFPNAITAETKAN